MKTKRGILVFTFLMFAFSITLASASDVAYIFRKENKIDDNVLSVFDGLNLEVDLINENSLPADFNDYKLIYGGDENFRNQNRIPVNDYPSIVANHRIAMWGLTDRNGASQLGANSPLSVVQDSSRVKVYTKSFFLNKISVPYYFLRENSKSPAMDQVAAIKRTSSGKKIGDVISYADAGSEMANGKTQEGNLCFFGIVKSDYWTMEARQMFKECAEFVSSGAVDEPECELDADCPESSLSESFCSENDVTKTQTSYSCVEGACVAEEEPVLVEECSFQCSEGACVPPQELECAIDADCPATSLSQPHCNADALYKTETSYNCLSNQCVQSMSEILFEQCAYTCEANQCTSQQGEIHDVSLFDLLIKDLEGELIAGNELTCNQQYNVLISTTNKGSFLENVTFDGTVGGLVNFSHVKITNFELNVTKEKTRKVNFTMPEGTYNLIVEAILSNYTDSNPSDNTATTQVHVTCPSA